MNKQILALAVAVGLAAGTLAYAQSARDYISIVGSSTVYPFATVVAEQFGKSTKFKTPKVESTGTGGGLKLFCGGVGPEFPDIANASRRIKQSEIDACATNGVKEIVEVKVGYDGIVVANAKSGTHLKLTREQVYKAVAKFVPVDGKLVANPYKRWSDIDPSLPKDEIVVFGPASNHGTRDAMVELIMDPSCEKQPAIEEIKDAKEKKAACQGVREDGAFVEVADNYTVTMQKLLATPHAVAILTFSYVDQNADKIQAALIDGEKATFENIASGKYPVSRPLYFYVKKAHVNVIPGIKEYVAEFVSAKAAGKTGYLADRGLIPMPAAELKQVDSDVKALTPVKL